MSGSFEWRGEIREDDRPHDSPTSAAERQKAKRETRKANGDCVRCGRRPAVRGTTKCQWCWDANNEDNKKRDKIRRAANVQSRVRRQSPWSADIKAQVDAALAELESTCGNRPTGGGYTYTLWSESERTIKIGKTENEDPAWRITRIQTGNAGKLRVLSVCHGSETERILHDRHASTHYNGEWFGLVDDPIEKPVAGMCMGCSLGLANHESAEDMMARVIKVLDVALEPLSVSVIAERSGLQARRVSVLLNRLHGDGVIEPVRVRVWDAGKRKHPRWVMSGRGDMGSDKGRQSKESIMAALLEASKPMSISQVASASSVDSSQVRRWLPELVRDGLAKELFPPRVDGRVRIFPRFAHADFNADEWVLRHGSSHPDRAALL